MKLPVVDIDGERAILHLDDRVKRKGKRMRLIDDMATCQDVYCGGNFAPEHSKSFRNTIAIAPLKSFLKLKKTVQMIGNSKLHQAYKQIDGMERYAMTEYQLYEKKQERTLDRISRIAPSKQLYKLDRIMRRAYNDQDELRALSRNSQMRTRKRRHRVKAKKRSGGTYMKRLKLASDSLKNTDPESSFGTLLNMESYLAFKDISKAAGSSRKGKRRKRRRRKDGPGFSKTEHEALQDKAREELKSKFPKFEHHDQKKKLMYAKLTEDEIARKKEEFFKRVEEVPTTMSIEELLAQPRVRRGFRPSKVIESESPDPATERIRSRRKSFDPFLFTTGSAHGIPTFTGSKPRPLQRSYSRREMAEKNKIFKLVKKDQRDLQLEDQIELLGSYADLTQLSYLRDDEEKRLEKRAEYDKEIEKLKRRRLGLNKNWINIIGVNKRRTADQPEIGLPKNSPMMPLIPHLDKRVIKLQKSPVVQKSAAFLMDILRKIDEKEEETFTATDLQSSECTGPTASALDPIPQPPIPAPPAQPDQPKRSHWTTLRAKTTFSSVEAFQKAFKLPTMTPPEKVADDAAKKERKQLNDILKKNMRVSEHQQSLFMQRSPLASRQNPFPSNNLHSLSTPNLPEKEPANARRSSVSESELGFKMNIFLSGLSNSPTSKANMPPVVS